MFLKKEEDGSLFHDHLDHFLRIVLLVFTYQVAHFFRIKWITF